MTIQTIDTLKGYFQTGDIPTQQQFADFIESTARSRKIRPIEDFDAVAVDYDGTPVDNLSAIQAAIDWSASSHGAVLLGGGIYGFDGTLELKSQSSLIGAGQQITKLKQLTAKDTGGWVDCMIPDSGSANGIAGVTLHGFRLDGGWDLKSLDGGSNWDYDPATMTQRGIAFHKALTGSVGRDNDVDGKHRLSDLWIERVAGRGIEVTGRGMSMFSRILAERCATSGMVFDCFDNFYSDIEAAVCGTHGVRFINASNTRLANFKSWFIGMCNQAHTGYALSVEGSNTSNFYGVNINTQDTYRASMFLEGHAINVTGSLDSSGYLWYMEPTLVPQPGAGAYHALVRGNLQDSRVDLGITSRTNYAAGYASDLPRLMNTANSGSRNNHISFWPEGLSTSYDTTTPLSAVAGYFNNKRFDLIDIGLSRIEYGSNAAGRQTANFADAADGINDPKNKRAGVQRWNYETGRPMWASGATTTAPWVDADGVTVVTPA